MLRNTGNIYMLCHVAVTLATDVMHQVYQDTLQQSCNLVLQSTESDSITTQLPTSLVQSRSHSLVHLGHPHKYIYVRPSRYQVMRPLMGVYEDKRSSSSQIIASFLKLIQPLQPTPPSGLRVLLEFMLLGGTQFQYSYYLHSRRGSRVVIILEAIVYSISKDIKLIVGITGYRGKSLRTTSQLKVVSLVDVLDVYLEVEVGDAKR